MKDYPGQKQQSSKPAYVTTLEAVYGAPSQSGFGSAIFFEQTGNKDALDQASLKKYKYFVGETWERYGEEAWMGEWRQVYVRPAGAKPNILGELKSIKDISTSQSVPMIMDVVQGAQSGQKALVSAYDDPSVVELKVYNLGDGGAMSGLLIAGRRSNGETTFLVFLLD